MTISDTASEAAPRSACENCGEPLLGEHCYHCGQPSKGLVRRFSSIFGDFLDSVFGLDSRVLRTLWPLYARPGALSRAYFAGHRVRYVSPVRLFVFLSVVAFVLAQSSLTVGPGTGDGGLHIGGGEGTGESRIVHAKTIAEVERLRSEALIELAEARGQSRHLPGMTSVLGVAENQVRRAAEQRIEQIRKGQVPVAAASGEEPITIVFNNRPWHAVDNPLRVTWLPDMVNVKLNEWVGHAENNLKRGAKDPELLKNAFLSALPQTLFVLLPLFALLLKLFYFFQRRLYMEHLIVALHSHAFLCLSLALLSVLSILDDWLALRTGRPLALFGWLEAAAAVWMPIYLLLTQKRIYGQGWPMTLLKYAALGLAYFFLLSFGAVAALLASVIWL